MIRTYDDKTHVAVPKSALDWLHGESGEFECPHDRYFRGRPPPFWWRSVFRGKIAAAPPPTADSDVAKDAARWRKAMEMLDADNGDMIVSHSLSDYSGDQESFYDSVGVIQYIDAAIDRAKEVGDG